MLRSARNVRHGRTLLVVLLVLMAVLAVAVFWVWREPAASQPSLEEGRNVSEKFLAVIRDGDAAQAWESTTAEFKSAQGREKFVDYVKDHQSLKKPLSFASVQTVNVQGTPRAEYIFHSADGKSTVRLLAGQESGAWRIDRLVVSSDGK